MAPYSIIKRPFFLKRRGFCFFVQEVAEIGRVRIGLVHGKTDWMVVHKRFFGKDIHVFFGSGNRGVKHFLRP